MTNKIIEWAEGIKIEEGWGSNSRSMRNLNPGNLKFSELTKELGAIRFDADNFAIFPTYAIGFSALCEFLVLACEDKLKAYHNARTLRLFTRIYALPPNDNYCLGVAKKLGVSPDILIKELLIDTSPTIENSVQRILAIQMGSVRVGESLSLLDEWFSKQGIPTIIDTVSDQSDFSRVTLPGVPKPVANPEDVKVIASRYIKDHHFVIFCYAGDINTPIEYPQLFLGANIVQVPILSISAPNYICEYMVHELLHGWYFRTTTQGINVPDEVHTHSFTDIRPEFNYTDIMQKLRPHVHSILTYLTVEEKIVATRSALIEFITRMIRWLKDSL